MCTQKVIFDMDNTIVVDHLNISLIDIIKRSIITESDEALVNERNIRFSKLSNLSYLHLKHYDIQGEYKISKLLVSRLQKEKYGYLFKQMQKYDITTYEHCVRVAYLATALGIELKLGRHELEILAEGALLHDVGKLHISKDILCKKGKLTDEEMKAVERHCELGFELLNGLHLVITHYVMNIVLQHHEDFDGTGYPYGLKDFNISKLARIVHIADVYDALCYKRPYKDAMDRHKAWDILDSYSGTKFDPIMYSKFKKIMPVYFLNEELSFNGRDAKVVGINTEDEYNPLVLVGTEVMLYSDYYKEDAV